WVLGEELAEVGVLDLVVVLLECPPLRRRGDGGHHPPSIPALRASRARPNSSVTSWWSSWPWSSSTPWSWSWLSWWSWFAAGSSKPGSSCCRPHRRRTMPRTAAAERAPPSRGRTRNGEFPPGPAARHVLLSRSHAGARSYGTKCSDRGPFLRFGEMAPCRGE